MKYVIRTMALGCAAHGRAALSRADIRAVRVVATAANPIDWNWKGLVHITPLCLAAIPPVATILQATPLQTILTERAMAGVMTDPKTAACRTMSPLGSVDYATDE